MDTESKDAVCIISFGNSTKYRLDLGKDNLRIADIKAAVHDYLQKKFPTLGALNFYDRMSVVAVDPSEIEKYKDYKPFDNRSVDEIRSVLSREVEGYEDVRSLNSNEPWGSNSSKV